MLLNIAIHLIICHPGTYDMIEEYTCTVFWSFDSFSVTGMPYYCNMAILECPILIPQHAIILQYTLIHSCRMQDHAPWDRYSGTENTCTIGIAMQKYSSTCASQPIATSQY